MESLDGHVLVKGNVSETCQLLLKKLFFNYEFSSVFKEIDSAISGHTCFLSDYFRSVFVNEEILVKGTIVMNESVFLMVLLIRSKYLLVLLLFY